MPVRTCLGCGRRDPQVAMLRIVWNPPEGLLLDAGCDRGGRGGYLHSDEGCWDRFARRKGMLRSLRTAVDRTARATLVDQLRMKVGR